MSAKSFPSGCVSRGSLRIDEYIGHVLDIAHLPLSPADFEQRVVGGRGHAGRIEAQHPAMARAEPGRQVPVLALDVMDDRRARPGQQRRDHETHALARAGWRKAEHMLRPVMAQVVLIQLAEHDTVGAEKPGGLDLGPVRPAG